MKQLLSCLVVLTLLCSCEDEGIEHCFTTETLQASSQLISSFDTLVVGDYIQLQLYTSTSSKIEFDDYGLENGGLQLLQSNQKLEFKVINSCYSVVHHPKVPVRLYVDQLKVIYNNSAETISAKDTLHLERLSLISDTNHSNTRLSSGSFDLTLKCDQLYVQSTGISRFTLRGKAQSMKLGFYSGMGSVYAKDFESDVIDVFYRSSQHSYLGHTDFIKGEIRSSGDIYLSSLPPEINLTSYYTGQLKVNN